jgi:periplasmic divalent cation tolerance protein
MSGFLSVYVTTKTREEAEKIARTVVEERLAACANILPGIQSIYRWKGKVEEASECAMILKTTRDGYAALEKRIKELHSYECPCIVATKIKEGFDPYLQWIAAETKISDRQK